MKRRIASLLSGDGLKARALRGSAVTVLNVGATNILRLVSNLILTRLLFPEAFGLMALVQVVNAGLEMFSDIGINTSVMQHKRGDDPDFLNTAWTVQILRGVFLWLAACAAAAPAAHIYGEPMLLLLLPVASLNAIITGFTTTNVATASRHLYLARQTMIQLACQVLGIVLTVFFAWLLHSVWALVIGGMVANLAKNRLYNMMMPGIRNRLHWDREAVGELIGFGKFIFLATVAGFLINQGDRAVLGAYIPVGQLGVYSIGYFLGTIAFTLCKVVSNKVLMPLYRMKPPAESALNRARLLRAKRTVVLVGIVITMVLAHSGLWLVEVMYDPRYHLAGPIVTLFSLTIVPQVVFSGYDTSMLANGDSKRFFILLSITAALQLAFLFGGIHFFGIFGAITAPALAAMIAYPIRIRFVTRYAANDHPGDIGFLALGFLVNGLAVWLHWDQVALLISS